MSRYSIDTKSCTIEIDIGWDAPTGGYFVQVITDVDEDIPTHIIWKSGITDVNKAIEIVKKYAHKSFDDADVTELKNNLVSDAISDPLPKHTQKTPYMKKWASWMSK